MKKKEGIIAFAYGTPATILSNRLISVIASQKANEISAPLYTQLDIQIDDNRLDVEYTDEQPGNPPPTLRIARGAVQWAKSKKLTDLWVAAAKPHIWRCIRDLDRAFKEVGTLIIIRACEGVGHHSDEEWFCPDSTQKRTQSKKKWESRERIIRITPFFVYKRIAA